MSVTSPFGLRQSKLEQLPKKNFHVVKNANRERTSIFICSKRLYNAASLYRQINRYCFNVEQRTRVVRGGGRERETCLVLDWSFSRFDKKKKYRVPRYQRSLFHISVRWRWFMKSASRKSRDKSQFFSLSNGFSTLAVQVTINDFFFLFNPCRTEKLRPTCSMDSNTKMIDEFSTTRTFLLRA